MDILISDESQIYTYVYPYWHFHYITTTYQLLRSKL